MSSRFSFCGTALNVMNSASITGEGASCSAHKSCDVILYDISGQTEADEWPLAVHGRDFTVNMK